MKNFWNLYFKIGAAWGTCTAAASAVDKLVHAHKDEHPMLHSTLLSLLAGAIWPIDMVDVVKRNMKEVK